MNHSSEVVAPVALVVVSRSRGPSAAWIQSFPLVPGTVTGVNCPLACCRKMRPFTGSLPGSGMRVIFPVARTSCLRWL